MRILTSYAIRIARNTAAASAVRLCFVVVAPEQAAQILVNEAADAGMLARELLRNPHWPWAAARARRRGALAAGSTTARSRAGDGSDQ